MRRRHVTIAAVVAAASIALVPAVADAATTHVSAPARAAAPVLVASTQTKAVPGVLAGLSKAHLDRLAAARQQMTIGLGVAAPHIAAEKALQAAMYNPASPDYHHFLTPTEFDSMFGVSASTKAAITSWLTADGLHVTSVSDDGEYVQATGTVAQLDKRFAVAIGSYSDSKDGTFLANNVAPSVPVNLPITAVLGLDTVQKATPATLTKPTRPTTASGGSATATTFSGTLTPQNLWSIYNEPSTDEGQGQTIGIFGEGETDSVVTQLRLFEQHFKLPKIPVKTVFTEPGQSTTGADNTGSIEWYLDVQASTGMAPKAKQLQLWFSNTLFDPDIAASISKWVNTASCSASSSLTALCAPMQMNASFGECETNTTNAATGPLAQIPYGSELGDELEPVAEPLLLKATMMGRTLFSSAGDTGSGCPAVVVPVLGGANGLADQPIPIANYPCVSAYDNCVGGTVITTTAANHGDRVSEDAWENTGGGPSRYIEEPAFQAKTTYITALNAPCFTNYESTTVEVGETCRGGPDTAALSGNSAGNGYFIYIDGEPSAEGGTSLSSPLTMGMWARLQAAAPIVAAPAIAGLGFAPETFYGQADKGTATYDRDFTDITTVEDPETVDAGVPLTDGFYSAGTGYDFVSGLGALNVGNLLTDVDGTQAARVAETAQETAPVIESTTTEVSPEGNATDPLVVSTGNLTAVDITEATLTTSTNAKTVTAMITGPTVSSTPDALGSTGGEDFYEYWYDAAKDTVYYLDAHTDALTGVTYSAGSTAGGAYTAIPAADATGTFVGDKITMTADLAALGAPAKGALLVNPAAITQLGAGVPAGTITVLSFTADSASYDTTAGASRGQDVCVGGCATSTTGTVVPVSTTTTTGTTHSTTGSGASGELAFTGLDVLVPISALVLVGAGGAALALTRRRRTEL